jgi:uncharacterized membrane protein YfcA
VEVWMTWLAFIFVSLALFLLGFLSWVFHYGDDELWKLFNGFLVLAWIIILLFTLRNYGIIIRVEVIPR